MTRFASESYDMRRTAKTTVFPQSDAPAIAQVCELTQAEMTCHWLQPIHFVSNPLTRTIRRWSSAAEDRAQSAEDCKEREPCWTIDANLFARIAYDSEGNHTQHESNQIE